MTQSLSKCPAIILSLLSLGTVGCREVSLQVDHYKVPCQGESLQSCLLTQEDGGKQQLEYDGISGFNYQWGHRYVIRARISSTIAAADGSSLKKNLLEIVSDELVPAGTPFSITLKSSSEFAAVQKNGAQYVLLTEQAMTCQPAVCQALDTALGSQGTVGLDLQQPGSPGGPLQLVAVH